MGIEEKLKGFLSKSAKVSKEAFSKAGETVQEFSDKSVIRIEIKKLEMKKSKKIADLGTVVFDLISNDNTKSVSIADEAVKAIFDETDKIEKEIEEKRKLLEEAEAKE